MPRTRQRAVQRRHARQTERNEHAISACPHVRSLEADRSLARRQGRRARRQRPHRRARRQAPRA
eukprot:2452952-Prymnesium_polylepis.1